ncbi:uncharacterized protein H6S33_006951 [Morchella sextelata]|uniref:uncharacterized protein n=1 Tax=Morchella sextelata TaxID=1174677 RepID=UPI001D0425E9|nr:uncharacterized protein H6S33_006951 [Morchella sextelata]KAH0604574.1 hypothetical protein H6S33_006951 [Morchella sextelata]
MPFPPGAIRLYTSRLESTRQCPFRQVPPGYTLHVLRALANTLFTRHRQALLFKPGEHSPTPSSPGKDRGYHLRPESTCQCSLHQAPLKNITRLRRALANALSAPSVDITHIRKALANALFAHLRQMNWLTLEIIGQFLLRLALQEIFLTFREHSLMARLHAESYC